MHESGDLKTIKDAKYRAKCTCDYWKPGQSQLLLINNEFCPNMLTDLKYH